MVHPCKPVVDGSGEEGEDITEDQPTLQEEKEEEDNQQEVGEPVEGKN